MMRMVCCTSHINLLSRKMGRAKSHDVDPLSETLEKIGISARPKGIPYFIDDS